MCVTAEHQYPRASAHHTPEDIAGKYMYVHFIFYIYAYANVEFMRGGAGSLLHSSHYPKSMYSDYNLPSGRLLAVYH